MGRAVSVNGVPIRLSDERWEHILQRHPEVADRREQILDTVARPDCVVRGAGGSLVALRKLGKRNWFWVYYKEMSRDDGFVITALVTSRPRKGERTWPSRRRSG